MGALPWHSTQCLGAGAARGRVGARFGASLKWVLLCPISELHLSREVISEGCKDPFSIGAQTNVPPSQSPSRVRKRSSDGAGAKQGWGHRRCHPFDRHAALNPL